MKTSKSIYLVFTSYENEHKDVGFVHLTYLKRKNLKTDTLDFSFAEPEKLEVFADALKQKAESKWGKEFNVTHNGSFSSIKENNILLYIHEKIETDVLVVNIHKEYLLNEKLFSLTAIMAEAIKEELVGYS